MKRIDVVAGVIFNLTRTEVLVALRKPEQHQGDLWEFPGGKLYADESVESGLARELLEELGIGVITSHPRVTVEHDYIDKHVCLHFRDVNRFTGTPEGLEGQELRWVKVASLNQLRFPEANQSIVDALVIEFS